MKGKKAFSLALVGTDSLRGKEMKNVLSKEKFPMKNIDFYDADVEQEYSKLTQFKGEPKVVHSLDESSLTSADLVFLAADKKINRKYGALASQKKIQAIDLSEAYSAEKKVPVVVAGVNDEIVRDKKPCLVSNPHPVTIILSHLFHAVASEFGILKAIAFTLQPVSAFEESGIKELANQSVAMMNSETIKKKVFKEQIAFNFLCQFEPSDQDGFSSIEKQIVSEIRRVLNNKDFPLSLSLVQAPVFHTYSIMVFLELKNNVSIQTLEGVFKNSSYFNVSSSTLSCPVSSVSVVGKDKIFIGQIKKEKSFPNSFWLWMAADNLTRGSALNAFEIAKKMCLASQA